MAAKKTSAGRRGFFFTILALAILSFMLLSMQTWIRTFELTDQRSAARFKGDAVRLMLSSLSDAQFSKFANASAFYATYKVANYSAQYPIADMATDDKNNSRTGGIERAIKGLIANGSARLGDDEMGKLEYNEEENQSYTISAWKDKVSRAANLMGFNANFSEPENFVVKQSGPWTVRVSFDMKLDISDKEGTMRQSKTMKAESEFSINGFPDPSITRNDFRKRVKPEGGVISEAEQKQIFQHARYHLPSDVAPENVGAGEEGNGWFFGPATGDRPGEGVFENFTEQARMWQYVLVTEYYDGLVEDANKYGAVILTQLPGEPKIEQDVPLGGCLYNVTEQTNCLNCRKTYSSDRQECQRQPDYFNNVSVPFIATNNFGLDKLVSVQRTGVAQEKFVLLDNQYRTAGRKAEGWHNVWDMTKIRDMTICGFYLENPKAPSFFQRMLASVGTSSPGTVASPYGIETMVTGMWAGGALDYANNDYSRDMRSRLDWQFYSGASDESFNPATTFKVKGMPGCRSEQMCQESNKSAIIESTGKFRMGESDVQRYGMEDIACNPDLGAGTSRCEPNGE